MSLMAKVYAHPLTVSSVRDICAWHSHEGLVANKERTVTDSLVKNHGRPEALLQLAMAQAGDVDQGTYQQRAEKVRRLCSRTSLKNHGR